MYQIIDNYLPEENYLTISNVLMSSTFPYYYQHSISYDDINDSKFYFNHRLYHHGNIVSWFYALIMDPILTRLNPKFLIRSKVNCFPKEPQNYIHEFHTDQLEPHHVALWYANTNNGKTILNVKNEKIEINSIANRMIIFDGSISHAPMSQTDAKIRVNVNINFL
jgi:hypothetical protein